MSIWPPADEPTDECIFQTHHASYFGPAEFCERETIPGTAYCPNHTDDRDPDEAREWALEQAMENKS